MNALPNVLEPSIKVDAVLSMMPREITISPRPDGEGNVSLAISIHERNGDRIFRNLYGIEAQQLWAAVNRAARVAKPTKRRKPE